MDSTKINRSAWGSEDYTCHWRNMTIKDMRILDLGCDWGSTAQYFLSLGAKAVIGVDKNPEDIAYAQQHPQLNFFAYHADIQSAPQVEAFINTFEPDIVKMDIEGAEIPVLSAMKQRFLEKPREWFIEAHNDEALDKIILILAKANYKVQISCISPKVVSAKK